MSINDTYPARQIALNDAAWALVLLVDAVDNDMLKIGDFPGVPSSIARAKLAIEALTKADYCWPTALTKRFPEMCPPCRALKV